MPKKIPKVGDPYLTHGRMHVIEAILTRPVMVDGEPTTIKMFGYRNAQFAGVGQFDELVWEEKEGFWYLPGRVLSIDERMVVQAMVASWPIPDSHLALRSILDVEGKLADHVNMDRLVNIIKKNLKFPVVKNETEKERHTRAQQYAIRCIEHCEELRGFRNDVEDDPFDETRMQTVQAKRDAKLRQELQMGGYTPIEIEAMVAAKRLRRAEVNNG